MNTAFKDAEAAIQPPPRTRMGKVSYTRTTLPLTFVAVSRH